MSGLDLRRELVIHPPVPPLPSGGGDEGHNARVLWHADRIHEQQASLAKRLTDAELAAEMWRSQLEFFTTPYGPERAEWGRRNGILERFATLPHYDEDQP